MYPSPPARNRVLLRPQGRDLSEAPPPLVPLGLVISIVISFEAGVNATPQVDWMQNYWHILIMVLVTLLSYRRRSTERASPDTFNSTGAFSPAAQMGTVFAPRSWLEFSIDVVIISYTFTFTVVSLSYCAAMWQRRRQFSIALRCVALLF